MAKPGTPDLTAEAARQLHELASLGTRDWIRNGENHNLSSVEATKNDDLGMDRIGNLTAVRGRKRKAAEALAVVEISGAFSPLSTANDSFSSTIEILFFTLFVCRHLFWCLQFSLFHILRIISRAPKFSQRQQLTLNRLNIQRGMMSRIQVDLRPQKHSETRPLLSRRSQLPHQVILCLSSLAG